ncbi:MAG TPA: hypothetical protein PKA58_05715 [Polyangium sp.]|nr:hypothetical protein [Polyangium sp.]
MPHDVRASVERRRDAGMEPRVVIAEGHEMPSTAFALDHPGKCFPSAKIRRMVPMMPSAFAGLVR